MKKLLVVLFALVAFSAAALAHNEAVTATSTFDCRVISPLTWTAPITTTLEEVIAGQTRTFTAVPVAFTLTGEAGYSVKINCPLPIADPLNPAGVVTLTGGWDYTSGSSTILPVGGTKVVTYGCTAVTADGVAHGNYSFILSVDAVYDAL